MYKSHRDSSRLEGNDWVQFKHGVAFYSIELIQLDFPVGIYEQNDHVVSSIFFPSLRHTPRQWRDLMLDSCDFAQS